MEIVRFNCRRINSNKNIYGLIQIIMKTSILALAISLLTFLSYSSELVELHIDEDLGKVCSESAEEEPELTAADSQSVELYHYTSSSGYDFYIAPTNIGASNNSEVGTRFESITNEEVAELYGEGWRLMTYEEGCFLWGSGDLIAKNVYKYLPNTYSEDYSTGGGADPGHIRASEYWLEGGYVLYWASMWGNRQSQYFVIEVLSSPKYSQELPVRPIRDDLPAGISVLLEIPHPVAVYDLNGRLNSTSNGLRIEVMNDGRTRKTIVR